jgi:hypothetical protein
MRAGAAPSRFQEPSTMQRTALLFITALVFSMAPPQAQAIPSFAGKWTMVADPGAPAGGGMRGMGQEATIEQDATSITITRTTQMGEIKTTHKLDGTETKNTLNVGGNSVDQLSTTKWDSGKLRINSSVKFDGQSFDTVMVLSLDPSGNLVVEATRPDVQGGGAPITTKATYKKS